YLRGGRTCGRLWWWLRSAWLRSQRLRARFHRHSKRRSRPLQRADRRAHGLADRPDRANRRAGRRPASPSSTSSETPRRKALDILKGACPTALPSTPTGRIEAMRQRLEAMLAAVRTVRPVVEKFYQSLNDEQKARFNALSPDNPDQPQAQRDLTQVCGERAAGIASLPLERIERAVQTD